MGRSVSDFSFKAILQSILIENQPTYKRKETVDIVKHYKNGQGSGQENLAVGKMFDCIFDNKFFKFDEDDSNFSILQEYYKNDRALGQFFNRKLDRGSIKGKKFLEAIANQIQNNPSGTIQHLTDNLVSFLRKRKAETITKEHTVFQELSPSKIGNKSADKIVEYIKVCANKDPYMALAVMLLISLYPIPSSTSRNPDLLETVITKSLLGSRSFKESGASQTDFSDPILNLDPSQKDDGDIITVNLPRNKLAEIRRILGFENVKEKVFVVLPLFSAIIAVLSIVHLFTRNIEFNPSDSRPDVTVISTGTTISSTITSSISTSTTTVNTTESSSNTISSSTANTDTTTDDNLNTSSLTSDITEPLDDDSGESNIATESEETTVPQRPISLNKNQLTLNTVGDSRTYHLTCDDAHLRNLNWTSSNSSIASVNQDGLVTALKDGTATDYNSDVYETSGSITTTENSTNIETTQSSNSQTNISLQTEQITYEEIYGSLVFDGVNNTKNLWGHVYYVSQPTGYRIQKYFLDDINNDNIKELILEVTLSGTDETFRECYTYEKGSAKWLGTYDDIYVAEECYVASDGNGLVVVSRADDEMEMFKGYAYRYWRPWDVVVEDNIIPYVLDFPKIGYYLTEYDNPKAIPDNIRNKLGKQLVAYSPTDRAPLKESFSSTSSSEQPVSNSSTPDKYTAIQGIVNTEKSDLMLRRLPDANDKTNVISKIPKGTKITLLLPFKSYFAQDDGDQTYWYYADYNGKTGFVSAKYIKETTDRVGMTDEQVTSVAKLLLLSAMNAESWSYSNCFDYNVDDRILYPNSNEYYFILPSELFCNLQQKAVTDSKWAEEHLNEVLEKIFRDIEDSAKGSESETDFEGLFDDFDVNSNKLGATVAKRNERLSKLLTGVANMNLGGVKGHDIDAFGDAYEYLMTMYASNAGKSGGEFFTPADISELLTRLGTVGKTEINKVYDPACGSGSLLLKAEKILGRNAVRNGFFGQEINITTYNLCRINMFLHDIGFEKFNIACDDTLTSPQHWDDEPFELIVSIIWTPFSISTLGLQPRSTQSSALDRMVALIALF